jgi:hypothetical protein
MGVAMVALAVAAGGAAFAAIPDTDGTVHTCYQKRGGALRVVESTDACRTSRERPLDLSAAGRTGGGTVVARARTAAPVSIQATTVPIPLDGNTWTQGPTDTNELLIETDISIPSGQCPLSDIVYSVNGEDLTRVRWGSGGDHGALTRTETFLLDPGSPTVRTVTARAETISIGATCGAVVQSIRVNVVGTS